jgi:hypothetical protein
VKLSISLFACSYRPELASHRNIVFLSQQISHTNQHQPENEPMNRLNMVRYGARHFKVSSILASDKKNDVFSAMKYQPTAKGKRNHPTITYTLFLGCS